MISFTSITNWPDCLVYWYVAQPTSGEHESLPDQSEAGSRLPVTGHPPVKLLLWWLSAGERDRWTRTVNNGPQEEWAWIRATAQKDVWNECRNSVLKTCHFPDLCSALIGWNKFPLRHDQSEALTRSGYWNAISMRFLRYFLHRYPKLTSENRCCVTNIIMVCMAILAIVI